MRVRAVQEQRLPFIQTILTLTAQGACIGPKGIRVQNIGEELKNEKIDIVKWSEDPAEFIAASLSPAKVISAEINEEEKSAHVVVPEYQLSLAIGRAGQNVRLAARLTGWKNRHQCGRTNIYEAHTTKGCALRAENVSAK